MHRRPRRYAGVHRRPKRRRGLVVLATIVAVYASAFAIPAVIW